MHQPDSHDADPHGGHGGSHRRPPRSIAEQFLIPLGVPLAAIAMGAGAVFFISQILLATGKTASLIALAIALVILLTGAFIASRPSVTRQQVIASLAVPAVLILAGGTAGGLYSLNHKEAAGSAVGQKPLPPEVTTDDKYSVTSYTVVAGLPATINISNSGQDPHNIHLFGVTDASGNEPKTDILSSGQSAAFTFTITTPGTYTFKCDVHPTVMVGTITAQAGAPVPAPVLSEVATDDKYATTAFTTTAGVATELTLQNKGAADPHNWHLMGVQNADASDIKTDIIQTGQSANLTFTIAKPGTYNFVCDVHPTVMMGTLTVK